MPKTEWSPAGAERTVKLGMAGVRRVEREVCGSGVGAEMVGKVFDEDRLAVRGDMHAVAGNLHRLAGRK